MSEWAYVALVAIVVAGLVLSEWVNRPRCRHKSSNDEGDSDA